jgi:hypothetical protein
LESREWEELSSEPPKASFFFPFFRKLIPGLVLDPGLILLELLLRSPVDELLLRIGRSDILLGRIGRSEELLLRIGRSELLLRTRWGDFP